MKIKVGTNNPVKVAAVEETLLPYSNLFGDEPEILGVNVPSQVDEQPKSIFETYRGAFNRAVGAYKDGANFGIGIESGIYKGPIGWVNFTAAVICNGELKPFERTALWDTAWDPPIKKPSCIHYGQSTGFPLPDDVVDCMLNKHMDLDAAAFACGHVDVPNIGKVDGGFLGVLTWGRVSRQAYSGGALQMALISLENAEMFG